ncbi:hypothetical protein GGS24DRAFT_482284 [Hypoxylon argillaceum]|nr:hypothetical protein GGS24DRAFT_482284 [Hypoxylon argillaceum]KAI1147316.1 hypothetical protein F4825DRAFT_437730 [Nemania diffusa]
MLASIPRLSLFWAALFSLLSAVTARGPPQYPTTLEVDVVFPRNDTYAPVDAFPLVVAIQNNFLSQYLEFDMAVLWAIFPADNQSLSIDSGSFSTSPPTYDDQRYLVSATTKLNSTEGRFALYWVVGLNNCSIANNNTVIENHFTGYANETYFTLQSAAQPPDLVAATSPDTCASMAALVLDITGTTPVPGVSPIPGLLPNGQRQCPIVRNATVSPAPCSVRLNQTQAASLSASATVTACDKWPTDSPDYKAACESSQPKSEASLLNTATVQASVWVALSMSFVFTYVF